MNNNNKTIIFLHLPKTAGTTLKRITQYQYKPYEVFEFYSLTRKAKKGIDKFQHLSQSRKNQLKFITGHIGFGIHEYLAEPYTYITVLRDPVERVISFYNFLGSRYENVKNLTLEQFVEKYDLSKNDMTKYLSGSKFSSQLLYSGFHYNNNPNMFCGELEIESECSIKDLELAKKNLNQYFSIVGTTEKFNETLILLQEVFGWKIPPYAKANVAKKATYATKFSEDTLNEIRKKNQFDCELYLFVQEKLDNLIRDKGNLFELKVKKFEKDIESNKINLYYRISSSYNRISHKLYQLF